MRTYHVTLEMEIEEDDRVRILGDEERPLLFEGVPCKVHSFEVVMPRQPHPKSVVLAGGQPYVRGTDGWWYAASSVPLGGSGVDWSYLSGYDDLFTIFDAPSPKVRPESEKSKEVDDV